MEPEEFTYIHKGGAPVGILGTDPCSGICVLTKYVLAGVTCVERSFMKRLCSGDM